MTASDLRPHDDPTLYPFLDLDRSSLAQHPDLLMEIYQRKAHGALIRNALDLADVEKMSTAIEKLKLELTEAPYVNRHSFVFPALFASVPAERERRKDYFREIHEIRQKLPSMLGVDIEHITREYLGAMAGSRPVEVPAGIDDVGSYSGCNFRSVRDGGCVSLHCGNYFQQMMPSFYEHLSTRCRVRDQLSYFFMLRPPPGGGGDLVIFDVEWKDGQGKPNQDHVTEMTDVDGTILDTAAGAGIRRRAIVMKPGDLCVFGGGHIWHVVEPVVGDVDRLTVGGFLGFTEEQDRVFFWS